MSLQKKCIHVQHGETHTHTHAERERCVSVCVCICKRERKGKRDEKNAANRNWAIKAGQVSEGVWPFLSRLIVNNLAHYQNLLFNFVHPGEAKPVNRVAIFWDGQFRKINNKFARSLNYSRSRKKDKILSWNFSYFYSCSSENSPQYLCLVIRACVTICADLFHFHLEYCK